MLLRADMTSVRPVASIDAAATLVVTVADAKLEAVGRLAQIAVGQQVPAKVLTALDDGTFLVVERGFGTHVAVRIYRASLVESSTAMTKTLLADLTATPGLAPLDNIEGITLGPKLADGRQSVIAVSDDNFSPAQVTQFLLFAL